MESDSTTWIIVGVVLLLLFFVVVIVGVGLAIFFISRKRRKAQAAAASLPAAMPLEVAPPAAAEVAPAAEAFVQPEPVLETPAFEAAPESYDAASVAEPAAAIEPPPPAPDSGALDFDPSRTVAINREKTVTISYGTIKFTSGVLAGQEFEVKPEGAYIGREGSLSQIVVSDPRISKRHLWIGVRDGVVKIVDQDSRNGTFINDPRSDRVTEAALNSGDTVILGESDVARFEYHA